MTAQTTVRFSEGEDLRPEINKACARTLLLTGENLSMNEWIVLAIREKLMRTRRVEPVTVNVTERFSPDEWNVIADALDGAPLGATIATMAEALPGWVNDISDNSYGVNTDRLTIILRNLSTPDRRAIVREWLNIGGWDKLRERG